jgi:predicted dehydrogenase
MLIETPLARHPAEGLCQVYLHPWKTFEESDRHRPSASESVTTIYNRTVKSSTSPKKIAVIGCGGYAFQLIQRIWTIPRYIDVRAVVSCNPDGATARLYAAKGIKIFPSVEALLSDPPEAIDAILNPTPIHVHTETTLSCLKAGYPVWLEKPPVATLAEYDQILPVAARAGKQVDVCFNSLYAHGVQRLKAEIVAGLYGKVRRVRGIGGWIRTDAYFERVGWAGQLKVGDQWVFDGTINNPLAHVLCNNLYFAAPEHHALAEPRSVEAELWHGHEIESEDTSSLRVVTKDGVEVLTHLTLCPEAEIVPLTVIDTEAATITLRDFQTVEIEWNDGRRESRRCFKENRIEMLEELGHKLNTGEPRFCPLEMCRPFTRVVETAFRQILAANEGRIPPINAALIQRRPYQCSVATVVRGINAAMARAHERGCLLSQCEEDLFNFPLSVPV